MYYNKLAASKSGSTAAMKHLIRLFKDTMEEYISQLTSKCKPKKVVVCFLYFPHEDESATSWADLRLSALGYNRRPHKAQEAYRAIFDLAIKQVKVPGIDIVPHALYDVLDASKSSEDYVERVQPSELGGKKMAKSFLKAAGLVE
jgi:hypothetical protein